MTIKDYQRILHITVKEFFETCENGEIGRFFFAFTHRVVLVDHETSPMYFVQYIHIYVYIYIYIIHMYTLHFHSYVTFTP